LKRGRRDTVESSKEASEKGVVLTGGSRGRVSGYGRVSCSSFMGKVLGVGVHGVSLEGAANSPLEDAPVVRRRVDLGVDSVSILVVDSVDIRAPSCACRVISSMGLFAAGAVEVRTCEAVGVTFQYASPT
jgi:hypothetical protein